MHGLYSTKPLTISRRFVDLKTKQPRNHAGMMDKGWRKGRWLMGKLFFSNRVSIGKDWHLCKK